MEMTDQISIALLKVDDNGKDKYFAVCDEDGVLLGAQGKTGKQEVLDHLEEMYEDAHARSFERSMSACIHCMVFDYSVVTFRNAEQIRTKIIPDKVHISSLSHTSGRCHGIPIKGGKRYWSKGTQPRLVSEATP